MFSGIVEEIGTVLGRAGAGGGVRLTIGCARVLDDLAPGASVAVDGVCQTVVSRREDRFVVEAGGATLRKTTLGALRAGDRVNLERALAVGSRLAGHFVQGHVNATGSVRAWAPFGAAPEGDSGAWRLEIDIPPHLRRYVALEGSLAVNGVSLTVAELAGNRVTFSIIPYTAHHTALRDRKPGAAVNLEVDMIAKYLESLQTQARPERAPAPGATPDDSASPQSMGLAAEIAAAAAAAAG